jgi:hypothetical protein
LTKVGNGKFSMSPQSGNEVVINVSGKMADGKVASDKRCLESKVFQVLQELLEGTGVVKVLNQILK